MRKFRSLLTGLLLFYCSIAKAQIILSESFDGTTFAPAGWYNTRISPPGAGVWDRVTSATNPVLSPHSGAGMARFNSPSLGSGTIAELGTLPLDFSTGAPYRVKFWVYRGDNAPFLLDVLDVYVNTAPNITGGLLLSRIFISRTQTPQETANGWYQYACDIPPSYNTAVNYIIFRVTGRSSNVIYLDDVTVESYICYKPTNVISSNLTTSSADLNWTAPSGGSPTSYDWELRTNGSPGTGSTGLVASGNVAVTSVSVSGLTQGFQYKFYVRTNCSGDAGTWTNATTFITPCVPLNLPYTENFDGPPSSTGIPPCMLIENLDGGDTWRSTSGFYPPSYSHSEPTAMHCRPNGGPLGSPGSEWLFTAPLSLQAGKCYSVSFYYRSNVSAESIEAKIGTGQAFASMTTTLFTRNSFNESSYQHALVPFTVAATGTYYIGFRCATTVGGSNGIFLDDIIVTEVCGVPTGLNVTNITPTSAMLNWTMPPCAIPDGYEWEIRTSGAAGSGATGLVVSGSATGTSTTTSGLQEGTNYNVYVRTVCSPGTFSNWSAGYAFKSGCYIRPFPYTENFDGVASPVIPTCIAIESLPGSNSSWRTHTIRPRSAPNCMQIIWFSSNEVPHNSWFFTPPLNLSAGTSYRLTFYYGAEFTDDPEGLEIKFGTAASASAMTSAAIFSNTSITNPLFKQAIIDFEPPVNGEYNIGFHAISPTFSTRLRVDDIVVDITPSCDSVRHIYAADITPQSATMKWDAPFHGTPGGYDWELRTSGLPGSGATGLVSSGTLPSGALSVGVNVLTSNNTYMFYIRSDCSGTKGHWANVVFHSACDAVFPGYSENFDASAPPALPDCSRVENKDEDNTWRNVFADIYARSQPNALEYRFNPFYRADDWFYTSPLNFVGGTAYRLVFHYRVFDDSFIESMEVKLGNFAQATSMTGTALFNSTSINNTSYLQATIDFTPVTSGTYYIGFHHYSIVNQGFLYVDDISVTPLGLCPSAGNFVIPAGRSGNNYQWQVNSGSGFINISDDAIYSGTQSQNLSITNIPHSYRGYQYRCLVDGMPTASFEIKFVMSWTGAADTDWLNPANWGACTTVPDEYTDVIIPAGKPRYPQVNTTTTIRSLKTDPGTSVTVQNGIRLEVVGQ